jgi:hypothetical protein
LADFVSNCPILTTPSSISKDGIFPVSFLGLCQGPKPIEVAFDIECLDFHEKK